MKKTLWTLLALLLVVAFSCKEDEPDPTLDVDQTALTVLSEGGSNVLKITSNASWTVKSDKSWAVLSTGNDNGNKDVTVVTEKNSELAVRTATITVLCANLPAKTVTLSQFGEGKAILIKSVSYTGDSLLSNGGTFKVIVSSNVTVKSSITAENDWLTENAPQAVAKTSIDKEFIFKATVNYDAGRTAKLRFFEEGNAALADSITVKQKAGAGAKIEITEIIPPVTGLVLGVESTTFVVSLNTNVEVEAIVPNGDWMTSVKQNDSTFQFTISANAGYASRTGRITFKDKSSTLSTQTEIIRQTGQEGSRQTDSLALIALYLATDGSRWASTISSNGKSTPWDVMGAPMDMWRGVTVTGGRVTRVALLCYTYMPKGDSIPDAFYNLPKLVSLSIVQDTDSLLSMKISPAIKNLRSLTQLDIYQMPKLTGTIPAEIGELSDLASLSIYANPNLTGTLPADLAKLSKLSKLQLNGNKLSGPILDILYNIPSLTSITCPGILSDEQNPGTTATISPKISQLKKLTYLNLANSKLEGTLPKELLELPVLGTVYLGNNNLTGNIPNVAKNDMIATFDVTNNRLSGAVPYIIRSSLKFSAWKLCPQQDGYGFTDTGNCVACQPAAPGDLAATAISASQIDLVWTDNSTIETGYIVMRNTVNKANTATQIASLPANSTSYSDTKCPAPNTTYYYWIYFTTNDSTISKNSEVASATTL